MDELFEIKEFITIFGAVGDFDFDAVGFFDGGLDGFSSDETMLGVAGGSFEQKFGAAGHFGIMNVFLAEAIRFGEGAISVNDVFLMFEIGDLVHENFDGFFFIGRVNHDFI